MRRASWWARIRLGILLTAVSAPSVLANGDVPPPDWIGELMHRLSVIPERHETFREVKQFTALDHPLVSEGRLLWRRPSHLEKITTAPEPETLVVDDEQVTLATFGEPPRKIALDNRPEIGALVDAVRGMLAGDLQLLARSYRVLPSGAPSAWRLDLTPRNAQVQGFLRDIIVEGAGTGINSVRIEQANGDVQVMTIEAAP